jgi:hypothetical protein
MALFGWKTEKMALLYTRKADRKRLARDAAPLLLADHSANKNARTLSPVRAPEEIIKQNQDDNFDVVPRREAELFRAFSMLACPTFAERPIEFQ